MKVRTALVALALSGVGIAAVSASIAPTKAEAAVLGGCPSFVLPPPCIVFDYGRLAEQAKEYAQDYEKLQQTVQSIKEVKANAETIGDQLKEGFQLPDANASGSSSTMLTKLGGKEFGSISTTFSTAMFGKPGMTGDDMGKLIQQRAAEDKAANTDLLALAFVAKGRGEETADRLAKLQALVTSSTTLREDWAANSQIRLEIGRQIIEKNNLMTALLRGSSVEAAVSAKGDQVARVAAGAIAAAPALADRGVEWDLLSQLKAKEAEIRSAYALLAFAQGTAGVEEDIAAIVQRHDNAEQTKAATLAALQQGARSWNSSAATYIVNTTLTELAKIDQMMASLRAKPISELSGAFAARNIDVAEMTAAGIDPRQFIGTWADPLKGETTLNMSNALLNGKLDDAIDGDDANDAYRVAVMNYNNARLEEAWLETHAIEASALLEQTQAMTVSENDAAGFTVTPDSAQAKLQSLVSEANAIAQKIQTTNDPAATKQASQIMTSINTLLNGA